MEIILKSLNQQGAPANHHFSLSQQKSYTVGRRPHNDLILNDKTISRKHCTFHHKRNGLYVEVLKSLSGLRVNGLLQTAGAIIPLNNGDIINIGHTYKYRLEIKITDLISGLNENQNILQKKIKTENPDVPTTNISLFQTTTPEIRSTQFVPEDSECSARIKTRDLNLGMQIEIEGLESSLREGNEIKTKQSNPNKRSLPILKIRSDPVAPIKSQSQNNQQNLSPPIENNSEIRIKEEVPEIVEYREIETICEYQGSTGQANLEKIKQEIPNLTDSTHNQLGSLIDPNIANRAIKEETADFVPLEVEIIGEYLGEQSRRRRNASENLRITIKQDPDPSTELTQFLSGQTDINRPIKEEHQPLSQPLIKNQTLDVGNSRYNINQDRPKQQENQSLSEQRIKTEKPGSPGNCSVIVINEIQKPSEFSQGKIIKKETDSVFAQLKVKTESDSDSSSSSDSSDSDSSDSSGSSDTSNDTTESSQHSFDSTSTVKIEPTKKSEPTEKIEPTKEIGIINSEKAVKKESVEVLFSKVPEGSLINERQTSTFSELKEFERNLKIREILKRNFELEEIAMLLIETLEKGKSSVLNREEEKPELEEKGEERIVEKQIVTSKNTQRLVFYSESDDSEKELFYKGRYRRKESSERESKKKRMDRGEEEERSKSRMKSYKESCAERKSDTKNKRERDRERERYRGKERRKIRTSRRDSSRERYKRRSPHSRRRRSDSRRDDSSRERYRRIKSPKRGDSDFEKETCKRRGSNSDRERYMRAKSRKRRDGDSKREYRRKIPRRRESSKRRDSDSERENYKRRDSDSERDTHKRRDRSKRRESESERDKRMESLKREENPRRRESPRRRVSPKGTESFLKLSQKNLVGKESVENPKIQTKPGQEVRIFDDREIPLINSFFPKVSDEKEKSVDPKALPKSMRFNKNVKLGKITIKLDHKELLKRVSGVSGATSSETRVSPKEVENVAKPLPVQPKKPSETESLITEDPHRILMKSGTQEIVEPQSETSISEENTVDYGKIDKGLENDEVSESVDDTEVQEKIVEVESTISEIPSLADDKIIPEIMEIEVLSKSLDARIEQMLAEPEPVASGSGEEKLKNCLSGDQSLGEQRFNSFMTSVQYPRMQGTVVGSEFSATGQEIFQDFEKKFTVEDSKPGKGFSDDSNVKVIEKVRISTSTETLESDNMADELLMIIFTWNPMTFQNSKIRNGSPIPIKDITEITRSYENYGEYHRTIFNILCLNVSYQIRNVYAYGAENTVYNECLILSDVIAKIRIKDTKFLLIPFLLKISFPNTEHCKSPYTGDLLEIDIFNCQEQAVMFGFIKKIVMAEIIQDSSKKFITYMVIVTKLSFNIYESQVRQVKVILNLNSIMEKANAVTLLKESPLLPYILIPSNKISSDEPRRLLRWEELISQKPMDEHQLRAISKITEAVASPDPRICIVEGSPGTGKTNIIVNALLELLCKPINFERKEKLKILVCGSSNVVFDQIILKLQSMHLVNDVIKMVRVEEEDETSKRTGNTSLDFLVRKHLEEDLGSYYESVGHKPLEDQALFYKERMEYLCHKFNEEQCNYVGLQMLALKIYYEIAKSGRTVKQISPQEWKILYKNGETTYLKGANLIFCSIPNLTSYCAMEEFRSGNTIPVCFVDDAAEILELDMLKILPFGVKTLVLLGNRLKRPMIHEFCFRLVSLGWGTSLFSRILNNFTSSQSSPVVKLKTQYRITKDIERWLIQARIFGIDTIANLVELSVPFPLHALRIFNLSYTEDFVVNEAVFASRVIQCIASFGDLRRLERIISVGVVISNLDAKERVEQEIENRLKEIVPGKAQLFNIEINTIEGFLNLEKDIILASCIRNKHLITGAGFQRFYSTLTKAKHCLIIYGRFVKINKMKANCDWHRLLDYASNAINVSAYIEYTELRRDLIR